MLVSLLHMPVQGPERPARRSDRRGYLGLTIFDLRSRPPPSQKPKQALSAVAPQRPSIIFWWVA